LNTIEDHSNTMLFTYRVVTNVAGSGTQVDDGRSKGTNMCKGVDMGHDIMSDSLLFQLCISEVDVGHVGLHFGNLLCSD
jgi:hypothetical protein